VKYKALVTDIDRTFSNQRRIFPQNINYLKMLKKEGVILIANTGRGLKSGQFIIDLNIFDYLIGNDGAFIYDLNKNEVLEKTLMKKEQVNEILKITNKNKMP
jgi:hydroxymethylpyrimidine pyrophosphatase-like HAD family hydrolase